MSLFIVFVFRPSFYFSGTSTIFVVQEALGVVEKCVDGVLNARFQTDVDSIVDYLWWDEGKRQPTIDVFADDPNQGDGQCLSLFSMPGKYALLS